MIVYLRDGFVVAYLLSGEERSCKSNLLSHPVTVLTTGRPVLELTLKCQATPGRKAAK